MTVTGVASALCRETFAAQGAIPGLEQLNIPIMKRRGRHRKQTTVAGTFSLPSYIRAQRAGDTKMRGQKQSAREA
jgi:hypothetical protein